MTFEVLSGPWSVDAIDAWLTQTVVPLRLATSGSNGPLGANMGTKPSCPYHPPIRAACR